MKIDVDIHEKTLLVSDSCPMEVLLLYLKELWQTQGYEVPFPFTTLDFQRYKVHPEWTLIGDTFNNIFGAGIATN